MDGPETAEDSPECRSGAARVAPGPAGSAVLAEPARPSRPLPARLHDPGNPHRPLVEDPPPLYAFRIEILGIFPKIWRMFYCPSDTTLDGLHRIIAQVMGWHGRHGHCFVFSDEYSTLPHVLDFSEFKLGPMSLPSGGVTLESLKVPKSRLFIYVYDFGDKWVHGVRVLDLDYRPAEPGSRCGCVAGKRACPPDDCGGLGGYFRLLEIMADPGHPDHADAALWSWGYDPDLFEPMPVTL